MTLGAESLDRVGAERASRIAALDYDYAAREKRDVASCNLCGSRVHVRASREDRYGYPAVLRLCRRCGLGFLSPRLTEEEYGGFYRGVYRPLVSAFHGRLIDAKTVQQEQRTYGAELVSFLQDSMHRAPSSLLDVGGSTGVVASVVSRAFGCPATVLDPAPDELAVAEAEGMETIAGFAERYDPSGRTWDLVLLCQTIDHLLDVAATLRVVAAMVNAGGHAFIDILDLEFALRRAGRIEGAVKIDHPFYLTAATARGFFALAGLDVMAERMSGDGHWGFLLGKGEPREPAWAELHVTADRLLREIWKLRACESWP